MDKAEQIKNFDPNGVGVKGTLFGLPFDTNTASVIVIPVPWDVTVSYAAGTAAAPRAILNASPQIDYAQLDIPDAWKLGIAMDAIREKWEEQCRQLRPKAEKYIDWLENGSAEPLSSEMQQVLTAINSACKQLMSEVEEVCNYWQSQGKMTVLLGGDHSTPLGHLKACAAHYGELGVLQIDAHADLREAYEGFVYSHASIMYQAMKIPQMKKLVQVGIRDFCEEEFQRIRLSDGRIVTFFDQQLSESHFSGKTWEGQCREIIRELPSQVYISFDIDGLDPGFCPNTGTPVPGGLTLDQAMYLIKTVVKSGRKIIGCDLNEVAPGEGYLLQNCVEKKRPEAPSARNGQDYIPNHNEWDANVGARALYRMINLMAVSQGKLLMK